MQNRLKEFREAADLSQTQLAERVGTTQPQIAKLEAGKREMDLQWATRLSKALDVLVTELLPDADAALASYATVIPERPRDRALSQIDLLGRAVRMGEYASAMPLLERIRESLDASIEERKSHPSIG